MVSAQARRLDSPSDTVLCFTRFAFDLSIQPQNYSIQRLLTPFGAFLLQANLAFAILRLKSQQARRCTMAAKKVLPPLAGWVLGLLIGVMMDSIPLGIVFGAAFSAALNGAVRREPDGG
jgi:hypothetical protein